MTEANTNSSSSATGLNESQARRLRVTCQYIDKVLGDVENVLYATTSKTAFPRYSTDIYPAQRGTIEDYIARVRAQLVRVLEGQAIVPEKPSIPASRAVHVMLGAIDIAAEELKPKYMRGYGLVPESVAMELNGIAAELSVLMDRFDRFVSGGLGEDLGARLARLEDAGNNFELLGKIERIVRDRGLVEFRSSIGAILDRAEDRSFEIALFGRVSTGKSSLLNAVLETHILPVGVTPITAVPTRIMHGDEPSLTVWFSESPRQKLEISRLEEFATEQQNPGNVKHVTRLTVELPSARLRGGVGFVDTPGLGSLAAAGSAETLAYLPKCDLGVVLVDAGSILTADDLQTVMALQEAAIPVNILLSKSDLLSTADRVRMVQYVKDRIASEYKLDVPVHPVSVSSSRTEMLNGWFENQIVPLYRRTQDLRMASLRRKIGALRDSVVVALEARLRRGARSSNESRDQARRVEARLRKASGQIEEIRSLCRRFIEGGCAKGSDAIKESAARFLHSPSKSSYGAVVPGQLVRDSITQFVQLQVRKLHGEIANLAEQLERDLRQSAADLGLPDAPSEGEFHSILLGTPILELPPLDMVIHRPVLAALLSRRMAERQVAGQISRQLRQPFHAALEAYWHLAGDWANSIIGQLKRRYETYAENYRAQAGRTLGGGELTRDELVVLEEDLGRLKPTEAGRTALRESERLRRVDVTQEISRE